MSLPFRSVAHAKFTAAVTKRSDGNIEELMRSGRAGASA